MTHKETRRLKDEAVDLVAREKFDKALEIYEHLSDAMPDEASIMLKIGDLNRRQGRIQKATVAYSKAAALYTEAGFLQRGIAVCKVILAINPTHRPSRELSEQLYARKFGAVEDESPETNRAASRGAKPSHQTDLEEEPLPIEVDLSAITRTRKGILPRRPTTSPGPGKPPFTLLFS